MEISNSKIRVQMKPMLTIKNISAAYKTGGTEKKVLHDISLCVKRGERVGIIGESGSGKTTLSDLVLNVLPFKNGCITGGTVEFEGRNLCTDKDAIIGDRITYIPQDPASSLDPLFPVSTSFKEIIRLRKKGITEEEVMNVAVRALEEVHLSGGVTILNSCPHELSGGMKQRGLIALSLISRPSLIIADEPTSNLDVTTEAAIIELFEEIYRNNQCSFFFTTHDLQLVRRFCDRIYVFYEGRIVEEGRTEEIFSSARHPYTRTLLASALEGKEKEERAVGKEENEDCLIVRNISKTFYQKKSFFSRVRSCTEAIKDVSMRIDNSRIYGIVGESGSGKTTLARILVGLLKPDSGRVFLSEKVGCERDLFPCAPGECQMCFQNPASSLDPKFTVYELLAEGLHNKNVRKDIIKEKVKTAIAEVRLPADYLLKYPHELSGGEKQRVAIARSLIMDPELLVFDEPTSSLDATQQESILLLIKELVKKRSLKVIFISHNLALIRFIADYVYVLSDGRIVKEGHTINVLDNE